MNNRGIDMQLQIKVYKYLDYIQHKDNEAPEKGHVILNSVSKKIREEVYQDFYGRVLNDSKLFKFNFSKECLDKLSLYMKEVLYGPGEIIYSKEEIDPKIYFINKGIIQLYLNKRNPDGIDEEKYTFSILQKGDTFGQNGFFTQLERESYAQSVNVSHLVFCSQDDFIKVLKDFPQDYEKFSMIRDNILIKQQPLLIKCFPCNKYQHSIANCPMMHLIKNKQFVIRKHNMSSPQQRMYYNRRQSKKIQSLKENELIRKALKKLRNIVINNFINEQQFEIASSPIKKGNLPQINIQEESDKSKNSSSSSNDSQEDSNCDQSNCQSNQFDKEYMKNPNQKESDKEYFYRMAKIKYQDGIWKLVDSDSSYIQTESENDNITDDEDNKDQDSMQQSLPRQLPDQKQEQQQQNQLSSNQFSKLKSNSDDNTIKHIQKQDTLCNIPSDLPNQDYQQKQIANYTQTMLEKLSPRQQQKRLHYMHSTLKVEQTNFKEQQANDQSLLDLLDQDQITNHGEIQRQVQSYIPSKNNTKGEIKQSQQFQQSQSQQQHCKFIQQGSNPMTLKSQQSNQQNNYFVKEEKFTFKEDNKYNLNLQDCNSNNTNILNQVQSPAIKRGAKLPKLLMQNQFIESSPSHKQSLGEYKQIDLNYQQQQQQSSQIQLQDQQDHIQLNNNQQQQEELNRIRDENLFILDFDAIKEYKNYYPKGNYQEIINKKRRIQLKMLSNSNKKKKTYQSTRRFSIRIKQQQISQNQINKTDAQ